MVYMDGVGSFRFLAQSSSLSVGCFSASYDALGRGIDLFTSLRLVTKKLGATVEVCSYLQNYVSLIFSL